MSDTLDPQAWNNFVLHSYPMLRNADRAKHAAAIAALFMSLANNGGLNSFLTATPELSLQEVLNALDEIGATEAARQLRAVQFGLGQPLLQSSGEARWQTLDQLWTDDLDRLDVLSQQADAGLMRVLQRHVGENIAYYAALGVGTSLSSPSSGEGLPVQTGDIGNGIDRRDG